jgi:hypothetical protein
MLLNKELNSHFKSKYFAYGLLCILSFSTSIRNNPLGAHQVFKLQKGVVSVMSGVGPRSLFRKLHILPTACQYTLSLMLFIVDNQKYFLTHAYVHGLDTRNKNHLYLPVVTLPCVQNGVSYSVVRILLMVSVNFSPSPKMFDATEIRKISTCRMMQTYQKDLHGYTVQQ